MWKLISKLTFRSVALSLTLVGPARAAATSFSSNDSEAEAAAGDEAAHLEARRTARAYGVVPFAFSPRVGDELATAHVWGGYDGAARGAIGEAVADGRVAGMLTLRAGATSFDLSGRSTAILGARLGILRGDTGPFDLGVGLIYQPQSIKGDGLVTATVAVGKKIGRLSLEGSFGYGQDPEADDAQGITSLGAVVRVGERIHVGVSTRARLQLWTTDAKFASQEQPLMDFTAGPLLAYSLGPVDLMVSGGISGLMLKAPPGADGEHTRTQLGPLMLVGVGGAL